MHGFPLRFAHFPIIRRRQINLGSQNIKSLFDRNDLPDFQGQREDFDRLPAVGTDPVKRRGFRFRLRLFTAVRNKQKRLFIVPDKQALIAGGQLFRLVMIEHKQLAGVRIIFNLRPHPGRLTGRRQHQRRKKLHTLKMIDRNFIHVRSPLNNDRTNRSSRAAGARGDGVCRSGSGRGFRL